MSERTRSESLTGTIVAAFPEYADPPGDPFELLTSWLSAAEQNGVREPRALALATADEHGRTSSRVVVLSRITPSGLVFATHRDSRKGRELAVNPWASGVLYWRETSQQVVVAGPVRLLPDDEADAMWAARPPFTHAMTTASRQSHPLTDVAALRAKAHLLGAEPLPRPDNYAGYVLEPAEIEFWANGSDRLHERLHYERLGYDRDDTGWHTTRLQP
ncbi:pyridoxamine 5'-phosphate oxidase [Lentzea tibetensis]|uniref:Pyridoxamine 5'-phosphate oxidase n=1 Tax=Lentzea tibetensis TaxID=2591470 RepID=A0A563ES23_9PSEU|nr:phenazine biosynthesis FMN-dependent oxidase PhzG [Lentzea tibetensis]TWP50545.1 pyridoxamine 5'-phosphate oxidase [Lentzea tibetensis]